MWLGRKAREVEVRGQGLPETLVRRRGDFNMALPSRTTQVLL
jgi:hypothetical protein